MCTIKRDEPSTSQAENESPKTEQKDELTVDEKVERAKQMVEKKREEKRMEEIEVGSTILPKL